jgi:hypothetical protein
MFSKRVRGLSVGLLTLAIPLVLIAAACADDGDEAPTAPADTPTADGGEASPTTTTGNTVIGAVIAYVTETGLDGETFEAAEPINCMAFPQVPEEEKLIGQICINFNNSEFSDTSGVMEVWVYGTETTWGLSLELQNLSWVVTGAEETTPEADEQ